MLLLLLTTANVLYFRNISIVLYFLGLAMTLGIFGAIVGLSEDFKIEYYLFMIGLMMYQFMLNSEISLAFYIMKIDYEFYTSKLWHTHPETYFFLRCMFMKHSAEAEAIHHDNADAAEEEEQTDIQYYKLIEKEFNRSKHKHKGDHQAHDNESRVLMSQAN